MIGLRIQGAWQESEFKREPVTGYSVRIWTSKKSEDRCSWSKEGFRVWYVLGVLGTRRRAKWLWGTEMVKEVGIIRGWKAGRCSSLPQGGQHFPGWWQEFFWRGSFWSTKRLASRMGKKLTAQRMPDGESWWSPGLAPVWWQGAAWPALLRPGPRAPGEVSSWGRGAKPGLHCRKLAGGRNGPEKEKACSAEAS